MIKRYTSPQPVTYKTIVPASAPIPTFDDLPPLPPVAIPDVEIPILEPDKKDKIIAELDAISQRMLEKGRMGRAAALREWGDVLPVLAEMDQHIADMHEMRNAVVKNLSNAALNIARTEWCVCGEAAYQLQGSGILTRHELTRLTDYTDVNEEAYDLNKEYM